MSGSKKSKVKDHTIIVWASSDRQGVFNDKVYYKNFIRFGDMPRPAQSPGTKKEYDKFWRQYNPKRKVYLVEHSSIEVTNEHFICNILNAKHYKKYLEAVEDYKRFQRGIKTYKDSIKGLCRGRFT